MYIADVRTELLTVDDTPAVLATAHLATVHHDGLLGTDDGERQKAL